MRFVTPLLCFIATGLALPSSLVERDTRLIEESLRRVSLTLSELSSSIRRINPRMTHDEVVRHWPDIERNCHIVTNTLRGEGDSVKRMPTISLSDALALVTPIENLDTQTGKVVDDWIAVKAAFQRDKATIVKILQEHQQAAAYYADAMVSRQSGLLNGAAGKILGSRINDKIQKGINAFKF
jgi:hypothetical protein